LVGLFVDVDKQIDRPINQRYSSLFALIHPFPLS